MKKIVLFLIGVFLLLSVFSCAVLTPNFLVGTWVRSNEYGGSDSFIFSDDAVFVAKYYESKSTVRLIEGTYNAGFSIIEFSFNEEKRISAYKMYRSSMDFSWNGQTFRLHRFN